MSHPSRASERRNRPWFPAAFLPLVLLAASTVPALGQTRKAHFVSTSVSQDDRGAAAATTAGLGAAAYHPSRVLVRFRDGAPVGFLPGSGPARAFPGNAHLFLVPNPPGLSVAQVVQRYRANPNVVNAEPDYVRRAVAIPTDPLWNQQWDMAKISAPTAWDSQTDSGDVYVVVIDTGIDFTHPDLQDNLDSADSRTCMNNSCTPGGADDFGHGTHCAGTIGAVANDGVGIAGLNWQVKLISCKFLGSNGSGYTSDAVLCFQHVKALKQVGLNVRVTSNSWGGDGFSQELKNAMADVEALGVVNVCAAGNSGRNADVSPMYPAGYDNRGIISVLASDQNDVGAGFTNYGLCNVDIAAPGVSTLSTVPLCTSPPAPPIAICDASGYKPLSGTSMATPHVSGVIAALAHQNPTLTAYEARDIVLDPGSFDALSEAKAQTTSTGGRLNFPKTLANPRLSSPIALNGFPTLTIGPDVFAPAGSPVNLTANASDPDNDPLRMSWAKSGNSTSQWLFGSMLNSLFPNASGSSVSFTAPSLARTAMASYDVSVADGRGGGAHGREYVTVSTAPSPGLPPSVTLAVTTTDPSTFPVTASVSFPATDPEGGPVLKDLWIGQRNGASGGCCYTSSTTSVQLDSAGVYRFSTTAIDQELNISTRPSTVVKLGGATGEPPIASANLDRSSGPVPLTVNIDMRASSDPDGTVQWYFMSCGDGGSTFGSSSPFGTCRYDTPGVYWLMLQVQDNSSNVDLVSAYVVATPVPGGPDTENPTVSIASPTSGAHVSGNVSITAGASDNLGVARVDFFLDSGTTPIGSATSAPYMITWDSGTTSPGSHSLSVTARDAAGNIGTSTTVPITVDATTLPQVSITSPTNGAAVQRKSTVSMTASVTPGSFAVSRVDFLANSGVVCSDATGPYSCNWQVPARGSTRSYPLQAKAYDANGSMVSSAIVTVTAR
jgi:subtilisin family serine protease